MPNNQFRRHYMNRTRQLLADYEQSKAIDHGPTAGSIREDLLKSYLTEMLPPRFKPTSGFVEDSYGNRTPQLDMIFFDRDELPTLSLVNNTEIIPTEVALLTAEVKTRLTTSDLEQIEKQAKALESLQAAYLSNTQGPKLHISIFVIAFETAISEEKVNDWFDRLPILSAICVANKFARFPLLPRANENGFGRGKVEVSTDMPSEAMLLTFVAAIYRLLYILLLIRYFF